MVVLSVHGGHVVNRGRTIGEVKIATGEVVNASAQAYPDRKEVLPFAVTVRDIVKICGSVSFRRPPIRRFQSRPSRVGV